MYLKFSASFLASMSGATCSAHVESIQIKSAGAFVDFPHDFPLFQDFQAGVPPSNSRAVAMIVVSSHGKPHCWCPNDLSSAIRWVSWAQLVITYDFL